MKRYLAVIIALLSLVCARAHMPVPQNAKYLQYIEQYKDVAIAEMLQYKIPASITLAQGILESGAGYSELTRKANNHFGIKCHGWTGRTSYHDDDEAHECFRAYDNAMDSYEDHSKFLANNSRYRRLFSLSLYDYKGWANGLKECGYATNPKYASILINLIELYNLDRFDHATKYDLSKVKEESGDHHLNIPIITRHHSQMTSHIVKKCNKRYYVIAKSGDTFSSLAEEFDSSARRLANYNERDKNSRINDGDVIFLQKKRPRADKQFKYKPHIVRQGESLYDIAQLYGIRLKKLIKKNHKEEDMSVRVGEEIIVY